MLRYTLPLLILSLATGCQNTVAVTIPLPGLYTGLEGGGLGSSVVIPYQDLTPCQEVHEQVHQEQARRFGALGFLSLIGLEYLEHGLKCGPLEQEAYEAQLTCNRSSGRKGVYYPSAKLWWGCP